MTAATSASADAASCDDKTTYKKANRGFQIWHGVVAVLVLVAAGLAFWLLPVTDWLAAAVKWVDSLGWIGWSVFVVLYVVATILGAPATPLNIGAGLVFGVLFGVMASTIGATIGGIASFLLARHAMRDWVRGKIDAYPTCDKLLSKCEKEPWKFLLMLRAHPLLPATLKNYCLGTTKVKLWIFAVATFIACTPTRIMYAYLGSAGHMGLTGGGEEEGISAAEWWTYGVGLTLSILLTIGLTWFVKKKLAKIEAEEDDDDPTAAEPAHDGC